VDPGQEKWLTNLAALKRAIKATSVLSTVLDDKWFEAVEEEIKIASAPLTADPSDFLYDFCHHLRDEDWFEEIQRLALEGRLAEVDEDARLGLLLFGLDPLRTTIPLLEARLRAFATLTIKPDKVEGKLAELRNARCNPSFKNHLFELAVLGDLALKNVLIDIEDASTGVDGVIRVDGRDILVEATNTVQRVIPNFVGVGVLDPNIQIDQVVKKVRKKVAEGRQLALANGKPTLLFLARTYLGAGRELAGVALHDCFAHPHFSSLSGVVLADSWKLSATQWHEGIKPDVPFSQAESDRLAEWYRAK